VRSFQNRPKPEANRTHIAASIANNVTTKIDRSRFEKLMRFLRAVLIFSPEGDPKVVLPTRGAPEYAVMGFVTFAGFACQCGALIATMSKFQCLRKRIAQPNRLESHLSLTNVTMPLKVKEALRAA
jgi:hypothetical protein